MKWRKKFKKNLILVTISSLLFSASMSQYIIAAEQSSGQYQTHMNNTNNREDVLGRDYESYLEEITDRELGKDEIKIKASDFSEASPKGIEVQKIYEGKEDIVISQSEGWVKWEFDVKEEGIYNLYISYHPIADKGNVIEREVQIDDQNLYKQLKNISLSKKYKFSETPFRKDSRDNEIRPRLVEENMWVNQPIKDSMGYYQEPLKIYLDKGKHTVTINSLKEPMAIESLTFRVEEVKSYEEIKAGYKEKKDGKGQTIIQAEQFANTSLPSIYPINDRSSSNTYPSHESKIRLNTVGGDRWSFANEWISWKVNIPQSGLYKIAPRFKQDQVKGGFTTRKLLIDGKVPFKEAEQIQFNYSQEWQVESLGNEKEYFLFYLEEGEHEITFEVVLGEMGEIVQTIEESMHVLNDIYRQILMLTGPQPDIYRDYDFDILLEDAIEELNMQSEIIKEMSERITNVTSEKGEITALLDKLTFTIDRMVKNPDEIASRFEMFKGDVGALGSWLVEAKRQPLLIDCFYILPPQEELPEVEENIFKRLVYSMKSFLASFTEDYSTIGEKYEDGDRSIEVWVETGRDQTQIIKQMIETDFTPENKINVNLKLVPAGTLLPSTLAGIGPDVSIMNPSSIPVEYAVRNAVMPLNEFESYEEVIERFHPSAITPFEFDEQVYGIPETQSFNMFFYRKDIFQQLGLDVPETFQELIYLIPELQKRYMDIGFPPGFNGYAMLLYQLGGELYVNNGEYSAINTNESITAFNLLTDLFTNYRFPVTYDFANRFRIGEMPCAIVDYGMAYNQLTVFAPEIKGLWEFIPVPGINPTNNVSISGGTGTMMLKSSNNKQLAWEFMDWWSSTNTQVTYANEMESFIGPGAKQTVANQQALSSLSWSKNDLNNIYDQWNTVRGIPTVPGGYYFPRAIDFAFNNVYNTNGDATEILLSYQKELDKELNRKREEFGLNRKQ